MKFSNIELILLTVIILLCNVFIAYFDHWCEFLVAGLPITAITWCYFKKRNALYLTLKDRLFLSAMVFALVSDVMTFNKPSEFLTSTLIFLIMIEHQLEIKAFRIEDARVQKIKSIKEVIWHIIPFCLLIFLYFGLVLIDNIPDSNYFFVVIYGIQLMALATLSLYRKVNAKSYNLMILSLLVLLFADLYGGNVFYLDHSDYQPFIPQLTFDTSKLLMAQAFLLSYRN